MIPTWMYINFVVNIMIPAWTYMIPWSYQATCLLGWSTVNSTGAGAWKSSQSNTFWSMLNSPVNLTHVVSSGTMNHEFSCEYENIPLFLLNYWLWYHWISKKRARALERATTSGDRPSPLAPHHPTSACYLWMDESSQAEWQQKTYAVTVLDQGFSPLNWGAIHSKKLGVRMKV